MESGKDPGESMPVAWSSGQSPGQSRPAPGDSSAARQGKPSTSAPDEKPAGTSAKPARKFKPTIPQRRKKTDDQGAGVNVKSEADDAFRDLIRAAQEPANWERSQGRGRSQIPVTAQKVVFGGGAAGFAAASRPGGGFGSTSGAAGGKGGTGARRKDKGRLFKANGEPAFMQQDGIKPDWEEEQLEQHEAEAGMLNYGVYYPTVLPLRPPGSAPEADDDLVPSVLPADLASSQEEGEAVSHALGLLNMEDGDSPLVLFQLPSVLPAPAAEIKPEPLDRRRRLGVTEAPTRQTALSMKEMKAGKLGKVLVFESGAIKLQVGEILMDVALGSECQCLQQTVAMNVDAKTCIFLGDIAHRVVVTPDMDQLLSDTPVPDWPQLNPPVELAAAKAVKEEPTTAAGGGLGLQEPMQAGGLGVMGQRPPSTAHRGRIVVGD